MAGEQQQGPKEEGLNRRQFLTRAAVALGAVTGLWAGIDGVNRIQAGNMDRMKKIGELARPYANDAISRVVQGVRDGTLKLEPSNADYDNDGILESKEPMGRYYVSAQEPGNALGPRIVVSFEEGTQLLPRVQDVGEREIIVPPTPHIENATRVQVTVPSEDPNTVEYTYLFHRFSRGESWSVAVKVYEGGDTPPYSVAGTDDFMSGPKEVKQWLDGETGKAQSFNSAVDTALGAK